MYQPTYNDLEETIERLELERDQLAAHCDHLESKLDALFEYTMSLDDCSPTYVLGEFTTNPTPQASLAEHDALVIENLRQQNMEFSIEVGNYSNDWVISTSDIDAYADQLRQQAKDEK